LRLAPYPSNRRIQFGFSPVSWQQEDIISVFPRILETGDNFGFPPVSWKQEKIIWVFSCILETGEDSLRLAPYPSNRRIQFGFPP
jgi:hypothetical protein